MTDESNDASTGGDASPSNDETEPIGPARPAADDAPDSAQPPNGGASARPDGAGVSIPSWLAAGLVVLLGLVLAGAGFAIGRATAPDDEGGGFRRIVATEGGRGGETRTFPGPGGPGGLPGFPGGGRGGDDGGQGRRGEGPRVFPGGPDRTYPGGGDSGDDSAGRERDSDSGDDSDTPAPPELPGT